MKHIVIFEIGRFHETADITRVFSSMKKAVVCIPKGFKEIKIAGYDYYAEDKRRNKWLRLQQYKVE